MKVGDTMEKLKIAICDDVPMVTSTLENYLRDYPNCSFECDSFNKSNKLIDAVKTTKYDIYLLDIEMPGNNGLEVAHEIRKRDFDAYIIFITSHVNYMKEVFQVHTFDYLLKPINREQLCEAISRLEKQKQKLENFRVLKENIQRENLSKIAVPSGNSLIFIDTSKISYIKGEGSYSTVSCANGVKNLVSRNLKNFEDILCSDPRFLRVHKSYIVNLEQVTAFNKSDGGSLTLEDKSEIPVSPDKTQLILDKIQIIKR